MKFVNSYQYRY